MLLAQVEGFLEVARRGNVSRAAEAMFVTQPTLTARLHALERELGEPLFARTRRGMRLTDAGRAFLPYAERATPTSSRSRSMKKPWSSSFRPVIRLPNDRRSASRTSRRSA